MNGMKMTDDQRGMAARFALITAAALPLAACVQVKAPDKPIAVSYTHLTLPTKRIV
jgi:hypothetical protein